jgi:hypothetical protein
MDFEELNKKLKLYILCSFLNTPWSFMKIKIMLHLRKLVFKIQCYYGENVTEPELEFGTVKSL